VKRFGLAEWGGAVRIAIIIIGWIVISIAKAEITIIKVTIGHKRLHKFVK
jgi:hypothetical protein